MHFDHSTLEFIIEGSNLGTWEWNVQTGETVFNRRWAEIVGYSLEELAPISIETWKELTHPEDLEKAGVKLQAHFRGKAEFYEMELRMRHKDGHWVWVLDRGKVYTRTEAGDPEWVYGSHQDISMQKELEFRLKQSEEKFQKTFITNPAISGLSDIETGCYVEVNPAFYAQLGFEEGEVIGRRATDLLKLDPGFREPALAQMKENGAVYNLETSITRKDGSVMDVLVSANILELQGRKYNFTTAIDISRQKEAERALQKSLEEKELLMREMNHRIKNNLLLVSSLISLECMNSQKDADLGNLKNRIDAIGLIHETLLKDKDLKTVNIRTYIENLLANIFEHFVQYSVTVNNDVEPTEISTDKTIPIGLIVNEIATNAVKHGLQEGDHAVFNIKMASPDEDGMVELRISDNGDPLPDNLDFEHPRSTGLQLIQSLVMQLGGTIQLTRSPHAEYRIYFSL